MGRGPGGDATDLLLPPQMAQALDTFKRWCVMRAFVRVRGMDRYACQHVTDTALALSLCRRYINRNPGRRLTANHLLGQVPNKAAD